MKKPFFVSLALAALFIVACSKDNDSDPEPDPPEEEPPTAVELVTSATWKIDTIAFDTDKDGEIDTAIPGGFQPCDLDNTLSLSADSTGVFSEGDLKCNESAPGTIPFEWHLKNNDEVINIVGDLPGELHGDVNILELTDSTFVMAKPVNITVPFPAEGNLIISLVK